MITAANLRVIYPFARQRIPLFIDGINAAMQEFDIHKTVRRQAAFLANVGHESGQLRYVKEIASGRAYEGRRDLGNTEPGDGERFKGRGLLQTTGRRNYMACGEALSLDLLNHPELLEEPLHACRSAAWFWHSHKLNDVADTSDFLKVVRLINGGFNGLADRIDLYDRALRVLAI